MTLANDIAEVGEGHHLTVGLLIDDAGAATEFRLLFGLSLVNFGPGIELLDGRLPCGLLLGLASLGMSLGLLGKN